MDHFIFASGEGLEEDLSSALGSGAFSQRMTERLRESKICVKSRINIGPVRDLTNTCESADWEMEKRVFVEPINLFPKKTGIPVGLRVVFVPPLYCPPVDSSMRLGGQRT